MAELEIFSMNNHETESEFDGGYGRLESDDQNRSSIFGNYNSRAFQNFVSYSPGVDSFTNLSPSENPVELNKQPKVVPKCTNVRKISSVEEAESLLSAAAEAVKAVGTTHVTDGDALSTLLMLSKSNTDRSQLTSDKSAELAELDHRRKVLVKEYFHKKNKQLLSSSADKVAGKESDNLTKRDDSSSPEPKKRSKQGQVHFRPLSKTIKIEDLRRFFHLPINEVAAQLGTCATALKKICRRNKINKWPFRQIRSITKSIQSLEYATLNDSLTETAKAQYKQQILTLKKAIDDIVRDPNVEVTLVNMGLNQEVFNESGNQSDSNDEQMLPAYDDDFYLASSIDISADLDVDDSSSRQLGILTAESMDSMDSSASVGGILFQDGYQLSSEQTDKKKGQKRQSASSSAAIRTRRPTKFPGRSGKGKSSSGIAVSVATFSKKKSMKSLDSLLSAEISSEFDGVLKPPVELFPVNVGDTKVPYDSFADSAKHQFSGPVQLAPLQRKKTNERADGKIIPMMEPDIGSIYKVDFPPRFILNILDVAMRSTHQNSFVDLSTNMKTATMSGLGADLNSNNKDGTFNDNGISNNNNASSSNNRISDGSANSSGSMYGYELQALGMSESEMQRHAHCNSYSNLSTSEHDNRNMVMMMMAVNSDGHHPHPHTQHHQLHHGHNLHMQQQQQHHQMSKTGSNGISNRTCEDNLADQDEDDDNLDTDMNYLQPENFADILNYVTN